MISNANIGTSITTVLQAPASTRYIINFVHFCNTSDSASETLTVFLSHDPSSVSTILKEITIPAGETFVIGTSRKLSNAAQYYKKDTDDQKIILEATEILSASSTGVNIVATPNYASIATTTSTQLVQPSPTPSPTSSPGKDDTSICSCDYNPNNSYQDLAIACSRGLRYLIFDYNDLASPHSSLNNGDTIFRGASKCINYKIGSRTFFNKVAEVVGPVYFGSAFVKVFLQKELPENVVSGTRVHVCDSVPINGAALSPSATPSVTPSMTVTPSITPSITVTPSVTPSPGSSPSVTPSITPSVTVTPSVTPSSSPPSILHVEYCKPESSVIYNIIAFRPWGLQANGTYDFATGKIDSLTQAARDFATAQIANYTWVSPLFMLEMVSENESTGLQTWRWTFTNWPQSDGSLGSINSGQSTGLYISEARKAKSERTIVFDFEGNGTVVLNFKNEDCTGLTNNNCPDLIKPEYYYQYDKYLISIANPSVIDGDIIVESGLLPNTIKSGSMGGTRWATKAGWGQAEYICPTKPPCYWRSYGVQEYQTGGHIAAEGLTNTTGVAGGDKFSLQFKEYVVEVDASHKLASFKSCLDGASPGWPTPVIGPDGKLLSVPGGRFPYGNPQDAEFNSKLSFEIYINGVLKTSQETTSNHEFKWGGNIVFHPDKCSDAVLTFGPDPDKIYIKAPPTELKYDVKKGDKVIIKAKLVSGSEFYNGASGVITIKQASPNSQSNVGTLLNAWNYDRVGETFAKRFAEISINQSDNFIRSVLPVHGLSYNQAVDKEVVHLGGSAGFGSSEAFESTKNCKLLLHSNTTNLSTTFTDSTRHFSLSAIGNARHSTDQQKFGTSSIYLGGQPKGNWRGTDEINIITADTTLGGSSAHTFECWFNTNSTDLQYLVSRNSNQQYAGLSISPGSSYITWGGNAGGTDLKATCTISTGTWYHVAVVVDGNGNASIYLDGDEVATTSSWQHWNTYGGAQNYGNFATPSDNITIGAQHYTRGYHRYTFNGYIDEVRWSDVARYNSSFIPLGSGSNDSASEKFEDLFFVLDTTIKVGDQIQDIFDEQGYRNDITGTVKAKVGNLYILTYSVARSGASPFIAKRSIESNSSDWLFINYEICSLIERPRPSLAPPISPSSSPKPSVTPSATPSITPTPPPPSVSPTPGLSPSTSPPARPTCTDAKPWVPEIVYDTYDLVCAGGKAWRAIHGVAGVGGPYSAAGGWVPNQDKSPLEDRQVYPTHTLGHLSKGGQGMRGNYWELWPWCNDWCQQNAPVPSSSSPVIGKNNPTFWVASNIGPWISSRPGGYHCPPGGTYGNGRYAWNLAAPVGSFPYWSGPLFSLRCLSAPNAAIQTWTITVSGWGHCQGPSYTSTSTKAAIDDAVFFQIGAGNLTIEFS